MASDILGGASVDGLFVAAIDARSAQIARQQDQIIALEQEITMTRKLLDTLTSRVAELESINSHHSTTGAPLSTSHSSTLNLTSPPTQDSLPKTGHIMTKKTNTKSVVGALTTLPKSTVKTEQCFGGRPTKRESTAEEQPARVDPTKRTAPDAATPSLVKQDEAIIERQQSPITYMMSTTPERETPPPIDKRSHGLSELPTAKRQTVAVKQQDPTTLKISAKTKPTSPKHSPMSRDERNLYRSDWNNKGKPGLFLDFAHNQRRAARPGDNKKRLNTSNTSHGGSVMPEPNDAEAPNDERPKKKLKPAQPPSLAARKYAPPSVLNVSKRKRVVVRRNSDDSLFGSTGGRSSETGSLPDLLGAFQPRKKI